MTMTAMQKEGTRQGGTRQGGTRQGGTGQKSLAGRIGKFITEDEKLTKAARGDERRCERGCERDLEGSVSSIEAEKVLREAWEGTLAHSVLLEGCGVHSGKDVCVALHPAEPGSGIVLRRTDLANGQRDIPLNYKRVEQGRLCTKVVGEAGTVVSMVEHLMCALAIAQIDNLLVLLDADELPILDGSAEPWLKAIFGAGIVRQKKPRRYLVVRKPVEARDGDRFCRLLPLEKRTESQLLSATTMPPMAAVDFLIDFPHPTVGQQRLEFSALSCAAWRDAIASARTFAFKDDIEGLRRQNLALGGSLDNAVLVDEQGIVNPEGLRYKDEFVRHKILDLCGDLYLAGMPILARVEACKSGHRLNNRLLHALFQDARAWREVLLPSCDERTSPVSP